MRSGKWIAVAASVLVTLCVGEAVAQPEKISAEQLFREGKRLMQEGNIQLACNAFEGSYRRDPAVTTLVNLADCREQNQQYATAWSHFIEAKRQTKDRADQAPLHDVATRRAADLEAKLSHLTINVPDEARIEGLVVTKNNVDVDRAEWNTPMPVDGGEYTIQGKAPGHEPWTSKVRIANAKDKQSVTVPKFHAMTVQLDTSVEEPTEGMSGKRKAAVGLWAVGAVGLGVGAFFELSARSTYDDAKTSMVYAEQQELWRSANDKRDVAQIAAGVGVAAIGAGVYLWISGGRSERSAVAVVPRFSEGGGGLAITSRF